MMTTREMEQVLKDVNVRTSTIEQILPTLATKKDFERFATKEDFQAFATKVELADAFAMLRGEIEESRRLATVLHEDVKADIRLLAEQLLHVIERLDRRP